MVERLRCRVCESEYPAVAKGHCERCFGPLDPVYDWDALAASISRELIEAGPSSLWRYEPLLPVAAPPGGDAAPGWTPLVSAPRLACASTGNLANAVAARAAAAGVQAVVLCPAAVEPEKLLATSVYGASVFGVLGSYDDCSRMVVELAGETDWAFVNVNLRSYYAEGSKTLAFEIAEQLGWEVPDAVLSPVASGSLLTKIWQGFEQFARLGLVSGERPRVFGGQAEGCSPGAAAFADDRRVSPVRPQTIVHSLAIGNPADGDLAVATARSSGGAIHAVPEDEVGP